MVLAESVPLKSDLQRFLYQLEQRQNAREGEQGVGKHIPHSKPLGQPT